MFQGLVFDLSLFGTWTWIPDEIFKRFGWPNTTKALFERVEGKSSKVWVLRKKCRPKSRTAIYEKVKRIIRDGSDVHDADLKNLTKALKQFAASRHVEEESSVELQVGSLANGSYGSGAGEMMVSCAVLLQAAQTGTGTSSMTISTMWPTCNVKA